MSPGQDEASSVFSNNSCRTAASKQIHRQLSSTAAAAADSGGYMQLPQSAPKEFFACSGAELTRLLDKEVGTNHATLINLRNLKEKNPF